MFFGLNVSLELVAGFPLRRPGFDPTSSHVEFVVNEVVLGHAFSEYLVSHANSHSSNCSIVISNPMIDVM
jgi:hypothetical protein